MQSISTTWTSLLRRLFLQRRHAAGKSRSSKPYWHTCQSTANRVVTEAAAAAVTRLRSGSTSPANWRGGGGGRGKGAPDRWAGRGRREGLGSKAGGEGEVQEAGQGMGSGGIVWREITEGGKRSKCEEFKVEEWTKEKGLVWNEEKRLGAGAREAGEPRCEWAYLGVNTVFSDRLCLFQKNGIYGKFKSSL